MNVVILEDEPLMAEELAREISKSDMSIRVLAVLSSVRDALHYLSENELPDLFFSDVQLSDGLSFEIFSHLEKRVPVIFCTAFDGYALQAFRANGIDYVLKPFDSGTIQETLTKHQMLVGRSSLEREVSRLLERIEHQDAGSKRSLIVHQGHKIYAIKYADLRFVFLTEGGTQILTKDEKRYNIGTPLDGIEKEVDSQFYRVNRQAIIHRDAILHIDSYFGRRLLVTPAFDLGFDIIVSKANAPHFLHWLES